MHAGMPPRRIRHHHHDSPVPGRPPLDQADTPPRPGRHPPDQVDTPPDQADTPQEADSSIRSTSGRYASYWNAFLFGAFLPHVNRKGNVFSRVCPSVILSMGPCSPLQHVQTCSVSTSLYMELSLPNPGHVHTCSTHSQLF